MSQVAMTDQSVGLERNNFFLNKVSRKFMVTSVISMLFLYAGSLIDTVLVGIFLGEDGLAAMSLVSPVYLVYYTVGATLGIGASVVASRVLGTGDLTEYKKIFTCGTLLLAFFAVLMTLIGFLLLDFFAGFLSGSATEVEAMVRDYLIFYIPGGACTLIAYIPLYFLKTEGKPKHSSALFSLSAVINVFLSWFFMSPLCSMGIGGAALATSISMAFVAILGFYYLLKPGGEVGLDFQCLGFSRIKDIVYAGIPNGLTNLLESAQIFLINFLLLYIGAAVLLPCYTIVRNVIGILHSVIVGTSSALIPLIGVFFGERDYVNERAVMKMSLRKGVTLIFPLILVVCIFTDPIFKLFNVADLNVLAEGYWAMPLACFGLVAAYVNAIYSSYLTAINYEWLAMLIVALRTFLFLLIIGIPLALLLGSKGIWLSLSLMEILTVPVYLLIRNGIRKKHPELDKYLLDTNAEKDGDISFSVRNTTEDIVRASENSSAYCEEHDIDMKRCMRVCMTIEEMLVFLMENCFDKDEEHYIDVRVCKINNEIMIRFRYIGEIFDPVSIYEENSRSKEINEDLLGLKMIFKSASLAYFRQTLGANNLIIMY